MSDPSPPALRARRGPAVRLPTQRPTLSVVVPMYDEEAVLPLFAARLRPVLDAMAGTGQVDRLRGARRRRRQRRRHPGAPGQGAPELAAAARRPAARQRRAPGGAVSRSGPLPRRLGGHPRRRPAGPARAAAADARTGRRRPAGRRLRRPRRPHQRLGVQAAQRAWLLPADASRSRRADRRGRRRLPAGQPGHRGGRQQPARAPPGAAAGDPGARLPLGRDPVPTRGPRRGTNPLPAVPHDPAVDRQPHRLLHRAAAPGHLVRPRRRLAHRTAVRLRADRLPQRADRARLDLDLRSLSPAWAPSSCSASECSASTSGRLYTQMQGRPSYFVAHDSLDDEPSRHP